VQEGGPGERREVGVRGQGPGVESRGVRGSGNNRIKDEKTKGEGQQFHTNC